MRNYTNLTIAGWFDKLLPCYVMYIIVIRPLYATS